MKMQFTCETDQNSGLYLLPPCTLYSNLMWCKEPVLQFWWCLCTGINDYPQTGIFIGFAVTLLFTYHVSQCLNDNEIRHIYIISVITSIVIAEPNYILHSYCIRMLSMIVNKGNNSCISYANWLLRETRTANNRKTKILTSAETNNLNFLCCNDGILDLLTFNFIILHGCLVVWLEYISKLFLLNSEFSGLCQLGFQNEQPWNAVCVRVISRCCKQRSVSDESDCWKCIDQ